MSTLIQKIIEQTMKTKSFDVRYSKTLMNITQCHTKEMGYIILKCEECKHQDKILKSCRNRNCPVCQKHAQEVWVNKWLKEMPNCSYYHIVATTPNVLYQIIRQNQEIMYKIMQKTSAEAIITMCKDKKYVGGQVGILQILHTWNQKMHYHPHCHMLVTGGGVNEDKWKDAVNEKYLIPVYAYSKVYRGKFIQELKKVRQKLKYYGEMAKYKKDKEWEKLIDILYQKEFVTYVKEPYENPTKVIEYFGRYAYRVAISESRILEYKDGMVKYKYKDRKDGNKEKIEEITDEEFVERFTLHILPKGFRKIKAYGIFANAYRKQRIEKIKQMIKKIRKEIITYVKKEKHQRRCSKCGSENVIVIFKQQNFLLIPT